LSNSNKRIKINFDDFFPSRRSFSFVSIDKQEIKLTDIQWLFDKKLNIIATILYFDKKSFFLCSGYLGDQCHKRERSIVFFFFLIVSIFTLRDHRVSPCLDPWIQTIKWMEGQKCFEYLILKPQDVHLFEWMFCLEIKVILSKRSSKQSPIAHLTT
jgi:hypothetical protein